MNGAGSTRNAFYHDHPVSNPGGARPHIHLGAQQGERFERDITPADSISNVDFRSAPSSPQKVNGPPRIPTERRTTRTRPSSKNNIQIRAKSPSKDAPPQNPGKKEARDIQSPRMTNRPVEKPPIYPAKTEKVLRESAASRKPDLKQQGTLTSNSSISVMEASNFYCTPYYGPIGLPHLNPTLVESTPSLT